MLRYAISASLITFVAAAVTAGCGPERTPPLDDFDTSCNHDSECALVYIGDCSPECHCPSDTINKRDLPKYKSDVDGCSDTGGVCECTFEGVPSCQNGKCSMQR